LPPLPEEELAEAATSIFERLSWEEELRSRDRIDATIAHEYAELHHGTHPGALRAAAKTDLPISDEARRLCLAMAR
jgi:hypothetical protein